MIALFFFLIFLGAVSLILITVLKLFRSFLVKKSDQQGDRHPIHYSGWVACFLLAVFLYFVIHPPPSFQLRRERQIAFERVAAAGGWDLIKRDCCSLTNNSEGYFLWFMHSNYSELPPALAALKPLQVWCFEDEKIHAKVARIHVLGISDTDRNEPYFGFWIVCAPTSEDYKPKIGLAGRGFRGESLKVTNSVFEIF